VAADCYRAVRGNIHIKNVLAKDQGFFQQIKTYTMMVPGSFRDPSGFLFFCERNLCRHVQKLPMNRKDIFNECTQQFCKSDFNRYFEIVQRTGIDGSLRSLSVMKTRSIV
jgi:hypothetical protein